MWVRGQSSDKELEGGQRPLGSVGANGPRGGRGSAGTRVGGEEGAALGPEWVGSRMRKISPQPILAELGVSGGRRGLRARDECRRRQDGARAGR